MRRLNKMWMLLILVLVVNISSAQDNKKGYLNGHYPKEAPGQDYVTQHQYVVDQIKDIANSDAEVRNVILMIGDGMGTSQVFAGMTANNDQLYIQYAKSIGFQKTKCKNKFTTDSAAAGSALANGTKTMYKSIGVDANDQPVKSILEMAAEHGKATGLVAACKITHATPAAFIAHVHDRNQYDDIAEFFVTDKLNVFIGGGMDNFSKREDGRNLLPALREKGFQVATSLEDMQEIHSGKIAGLFTGGHIAKYPARGEFLPESTDKALEILSQNKQGFFMMVEGSQIDWGGHDNDLGYVIEETLDFDRTVGEVLKFAKKDGHTLVIITADHETGGLSIFDSNPAKGEVHGRFSSGGHSSVMVPVFAYGPGADAFKGIYEDTAIFKKMVAAFGFDAKKKN